MKEQTQTQTGIPSITVDRDGQNYNYDDPWLTSKEAREYLRVSAVTWQRIRDERRLSFSQIGRIIRVRKSALDDYLTSHTIKRTPNNNIE